MNNRSDFEEFLMFDFSSIKEDVPKIEERAYAFAITLAAGGNTIPQSLVRAYSDGTEIPEALLNDTLLYISGMGYITVICDCFDYICALRELEESSWYNEGVLARESRTEVYLKIGKDILLFREELDL